MAAELPAVVVCPASLILNWRREIDLWRPEAAGEFSVLSYADRRLGTLSPSVMARLYNTVIGDEIHFVKSPKAMRSTLTCGLIAAIGERGKAIALSGTVVPNRPIELWPLLFSMGITSRNYYSFARRYADAWQAPWGFDVSGSSREGELRGVLAPHMIRFTKAQVLPQLPPKTWRVIALDLPTPRQEKAFDLASLGEMPEALAFEALSDVLKMAGQRKIPRALEYIETVLVNKPKVVVFAHHREVVAQLVEKLAPYHPATLVGGMTTKRKQEAIDAFQSDPAVRVIVGQNVAMGVGHTLTASSHVVIVEGSWVPGDLEQMADRCHRIGQHDNVTADILTIDGSIDEHMIHRALTKQETVNAIVPVSTPGATRVAEKNLDTSSDLRLHTHQPTHEGGPLMNADIKKAIDQIAEGLTSLVELAQAMEAPAAEKAAPKAAKKATKKKATRKKAKPATDGPSMDEVRAACMELVELVTEFGDDDDDGAEILLEIIEEVDEGSEGVLSNLEGKSDELALVIKAVKSYIEENYPEDDED